MATAVSLDGLLRTRRVWRGQPTAALQPDGQPTGVSALDDALPQGGWPPHALIEILLPADGVGELQLLWPVLARLTQARGTVALIAPPYVPHAPAWHGAGIALAQVQLIRADRRDALWAAEQCLRAGACHAVMCWPGQADDRALRRLQVAAETGRCLGFAIRPLQAERNPSPAALRLAIDRESQQLRVLKCRGALPPWRAIPFPRAVH